mgnify:CR=1 FL=1
MSKFKFKTAKEYVQELKKADDLYYNKDEKSDSMSDAEYDALKDEFTARFPDHEYLKEVGAQTVSGTKVKHEIPMGSQSKVNTESELEDWALKVEEKVGSVEYLVSEKLDGFSLALKYEKNLVQGVSRGDGIEGEDLTSNSKKIKDIPSSISSKNKTLVRGETILKKSVYQNLFTDKANPRNAAAGTIRRLDGERCEHLSFLAYDVIQDGHKFKTELEKFEFLKSQGFETPSFRLCKDLSEVKEFYNEYEQSKRDSSDFEMDGLVVMVNDIKAQNLLGIINNRPRYSRAYKFSAQSGITQIKEVVWQVGRTGRITPVAKTEPVKVAGVTITSVTLHNLSEIERLNLKIGQTVEVLRAGDVIPKIVKVIKSAGEKIKIPSACPVCSQKTTKGEIFLTCDNPNCESKLYHGLLYWVKTLDIKGFGQELVDRLQEAGLITEPADFYALTKEQLSDLERMGEKSAEKVLKELHSKKELTIPVFVKGLGIAQVSEKTLDLVMPTHSSLEKIMEAKPEELAAIHGIGDVTSKLLIDGLKSRRKIIENLLKYISLKAPKKVEGGKLQGKSFCFTGVRDKNIEVAIVDNGGKIASGVSATLSYLVAKDPDENSSKLKKAKELRVEILTLEQAWEKVR